MTDICMQSLFSGGLFLVVEGDNSLGEVSVWMGFFFFFVFFGFCCRSEDDTRKDERQGKRGVEG